MHQQQINTDFVENSLPKDLTEYFLLFATNLHATAISTRLPVNASLDAIFHVIALKKLKISTLVRIFLNTLDKSSGFVERQCLKSTKVLYTIHLSDKWRALL